ncbi:hypothetical protein [[Eubacterium] cellulosolvens]
MTERNAVDEIEAVFVSELGIGSKFVLDKSLRDLGLSRDSVQNDDINSLIKKLLREYNKVLGEHVQILENELNKRVHN